MSDARTIAVYRGTCHGCGAPLAVELAGDAAQRLLPPPTVLGIHQCARPPVETTLAYGTVH